MLEKKWQSVIYGLRLLVKKLLHLVLAHILQLDTK